MLREAQTVDDNGVTHKVKKKAYLEYKSVLNLAFQYALYKDIITVNPVAKLKNKVYFKECDCSKPVSEDKIFSDEEIKTIIDTVRSRMKQNRYNGYFINGYAILFSIETGVRCGEIPSLKWSDIHSNYVHIHSQQLSNRRKGYIEYYYADYTKDEKGESKDDMDDLVKLFDQNGPEAAETLEVSPKSHPKVVNFRKKARKPHGS